MLTNQEMLIIAKKYMSFSSDKDIELKVTQGLTITKPYGNIYYYDSKKYIETGNFQYHVPTGPFLVEKATGRVVGFGTARSFEFYIDAYEKGTLVPTLDRYWYPDTQKYSHK
ncbi:MAG: hypothetical protein AB8B65_02630 [Kordia sp.]|uniref:hypothetical protein n=1 Tax=Kordia sp. TaxID=1965332 RepID=UPI00385BB14B